MKLLVLEDVNQTNKSYNMYIIYMYIYIGNVGYKCDRNNSMKNVLFNIARHYLIFYTIYLKKLKFSMFIP